MSSMDRPVTLTAPSASPGTRNLSFTASQTASPTTDTPSVSLHISQTTHGWARESWVACLALRASGTLLRKWQISTWSQGLLWSDRPTSSRKVRKKWQGRQDFSSWGWHPPQQGASSLDVLAWAGLGSFRKTGDGYKKEKKMPTNGFTEACQLQGP